METLIKPLADAGLGLGALLVVGYLLITQSSRQEKKDKAYIETLATIQSSIMKIQTDGDRNWAITQDIARNVSDTTRALAQIKCLK